MKIRSQLADVDFDVGGYEVKREYLIVRSAPSQPMQSKVYLSPDDIVAVIGKALANPWVWVYLLGFPFFLIKYRLRRRAAAKNKLVRN